MNTVFESNIPNLKLINRGKVRDIYEVDRDHLLIVTSDRLSAFDSVLPQPIPTKGEILTRVSNFWFDRTNHIIPNQLSDLPLDQIIPDSIQREYLGDRVIVVQKLQPVLIEAIVRGYLIGSGWKDYQKTNSVCGIKLPNGLQLADKLPTVLYTPSTKAAIGDHDENITFKQTANLIGSDLATTIRDISLQIYNESAKYALERGIIIADTKFEFGLDQDNKLHLIDEVLTPDSSRFWAVDEYKVGISPPSFDKQIVRDYLESIKWNKKPPYPTLPDSIINKTVAKYSEVERVLINNAD
jgi:phosphoribosylaminoimidazole-succinocarboxamide synthase